MASFRSNEEFFHAVADLMTKLEVGGHPQAAAKLREGFGYLNGLTDGWALFLESIQRAENTHAKGFARDERNALERIRTAAHAAVYRRCVRSPRPAGPADASERIDRAAYPFTSRWMDLTAGWMHYIDEGGGEPLLFVHGTPTWSFEWPRLRTSEGIEMSDDRTQELVGPAVALSALCFAMRRSRGTVGGESTRRSSPGVRAHASRTRATRGAKSSRA